MKLLFFTIATVLASVLASTIEPPASALKNDTTIAEPDQEICILSIVPCPKRCRDTCIYPDVPCPKTHPPHCPNETPKHWPLHQKRSDSTVRSNTVVSEQDDGIEETNCLDRPCPRVIFKPCPKACPSSCEFQNPANPCCPYSGKPVCMALN
ncbi:uncharacterized protein ATC70_002492 [Mucor velutinosus]|uniref:Uncharacterized protein n=1 Tax=Mucor velutinosus TaxID=708070 RepID=A0AAN7DH99_9FUNG|nr:hypothetical protein ATC70_002492 [Mucor velutinosus]